MDVVKELASNDKAYRSLTVSWFKNSPFLSIIQQAQHLGFKLIGGDKFKMCGFSEFFK